MSAANILLLAYVSLLPFGKYYSATYSKARIYHKKCISIFASILFHVPTIHFEYANEN